MKQTVIAISGVKNSGKTTLIEQMLPYLKAAGLTVAVIKHDGHGFEAERPGTDTYRHLAAGAAATAVFDGEKVQIVRRVQTNVEELIGLFPDADLILLEGMKHSDYPKLEVVRKGVSKTAVSDPETLLAIVSDLPFEGLPRIPLGDAKEAARRILAYREQGE